MTKPSLPTPPFFAIPNINNLRDAALLPPRGLPTANGGQVRPGILFRSAEVSKLDRSGWAALKRVGIGHVFDLRSKPEVDRGWAGITGEKDGNAHYVRPGWMQDLEEEGLQRTWTPVFEESDYSPERLAERYLKYMGEGVDGFVQAYEDILRHAGPAYRAILLYLANLPAPRTEATKHRVADANGDSDAIGALIHCTAGKDRTGIFFGVLLAFLGVDHQLIADEYNLTEAGLAHERDNIVARLMLSPGFKKYIHLQTLYPGLSVSELAKTAMKNGVDGEEALIPESDVPKEALEKGREAALRMTGARKESMLGALRMVERVWGGPEGYLRSVCELGDVELEKLRRNLIVQR